MEKIKVGVSDNVSAFTAEVIGTRVLDRESFMGMLREAIAAHDPEKDRAPGQHFIVLPDAALPLVSAGVGRRTGRPEDYLLRAYRGRVDAFLRREFAARAEKVAAVVYTAAAYFRDPDVTEAQASQIRDEAATHVLVAVLAFAGPEAPLSPYRLVHNLAGGNREAEAWNVDEIRAKAKAAKAYWDEWSVVAD